MITPMRALLYLDDRPIPGVREITVEHLIPSHPVFLRIGDSEPLGWERSEAWIVRYVTSRDTEISPMLTYQEIHPAYVTRTVVDGQLAYRAYTQRPAHATAFVPFLPNSAYTPAAPSWEGPPAPTEGYTVQSYRYYTAYSQTYDTLDEALADARAGTEAGAHSVYAILHGTVEVPGWQEMIN